VTAFCFSEMRKGLEKFAKVITGGIRKNGRCESGTVLAD
jgi:hypothetical protein